MIFNAYELQDCSFSAACILADAVPFFKPLPLLLECFLVSLPYISVGGRALKGEEQLTSSLLLFLQEGAVGGNLTVVKVTRICVSAFAMLPRFL